MTSIFLVAFANNLRRHYEATSLVNRIYPDGIPKLSEEESARRKEENLRYAVRHVLETMEEQGIDPEEWNELLEKYR